MSEHPTRFRFYRYEVCSAGLSWFIFDSYLPRHILDTTYTTKAEAEAVCKLLNAGEELYMKGEAK